MSIKLEKLPNKKTAMHFPLGTHFFPLNIDFYCVCLLCHQNTVPEEGLDVLVPTGPPLKKWYCSDDCNMDLVTQRASLSGPIKLLAVICLLSLTDLLLRHGLGCSGHWLLPFLTPGH